jgi:hypothetical protein
MKFKTLLLVLTALISYHASAQCPSCTVVSNVHPNTGPGDLGVVPSAVTIQAGADTTIVFQYLMPQTLAVSGLTATVTSVQILQVQNLPPATTSFCWTSDQAANNHIYYPQTYRYGCVTMNINTLAPAGTYTVNILVNGCGSAAGITQCQNQNVPLTITVLPPTGNPFFSLSGNVACDSLEVDFTQTLIAPLPINPTTYSWDLGNGVLATGPTANTTYVGVGQYIVSLTETIEEYYISAASLTASSSGCYCGDIEEPTIPILGCTAAPEPYLIINAGGGNVTLGNPSSNTTVSWSNIDIPISSTAVSIQAWEDDNGSPFGSQDDNLGSALLTFNSNPGIGSQSFSTSCANGSITLSKRVKATNTYTDTVNILPPSAIPLISNNGGNPICNGDSVVLSSTVSVTYQWYLDSLAISGATAQSIVAKNEGDYYVITLDAGTICASSSAVYALDFETVQIPVIGLTATGLGLYVSNIDNNAVQWYANGSGIAVPIPGATNDTLPTFNPLNAPFTVLFTSLIGCTQWSAPFDICVEGTSSASGNTVNLSTSVTLSHDNFILKPGNDVAWAVSTQADGAITDMNGLQAAITAGWIIPADNATGVLINCSKLPSNLANGDYYFTPISAASLVIDSIIHFPTIDSGCVSDAQLCLALSATPGVLLITDSLIFTFPDGSTANLRDIVPASFQALLPDTINEGLIGLLPSIIPGGALCFALTDLYPGNPNGTWTIEALNVGTGSLTISIDDIVSGVYADSCPVITVDQIITIPGQNFTIGANTNASVSFTLPPLPANFPTINVDCNVFGGATLITINCGTGIEEIINVASLNLYPNPNSGSFTLEFEVLERSDVQLEIFDLTGRRLLSNTYTNAYGQLKETFNLSNNLSSGFYVLNLNIKGNQIQKHFIVK